MVKCHDTGRDFLLNNKLAIQRYDTPTIYGEVERFSSLSQRYHSSPEGRDLTGNQGYQAIKTV